MFDAEDFTGLDPYEPELGPLTLLNGDEGKPLDGGRKPISTLLSYKFPELSKSDSWTQWGEWQGQRVRLYTARIAQLMQRVSQKNEGGSVRQERLVAISGMTSSGLMQAPPSPSEFTVNGIQPPSLFDSDALARFNPEVHLEGGVPSAITVPGMTSIDAVNAFVKARHPGYEVYYDITTSDQSSIAANFFTGGLGDNRQGLDVTQIVVVYGDGRVEALSDPLAIQALRGTQGYACMGTEFTLRLKKTPEVEEMLVLDLNGSDHEKAYGESVPELISYLAPYMRGREENGIWVDGVEIVDSSGLKTVLRVTGGSHTPPALMAEQLLRELGARSVGSILLRVRHGSDESSAQEWGRFLDGLGRMSRPEQELIRLVKEVFGSETVPGNEEESLEVIRECAKEDGFLEGFAEKEQYFRYLLELLDETETPESVSKSILCRIQLVMDPVQRERWRILRKEIPEMRRKEGEKLASGSMDRDIKFKLLDVDSNDPDACRGQIAEAIQRVMGVYLKIQKKAEEQECHVMWNGHLNYISPEDAHLGYYDGGGNLHLAITAKNASVTKATVDALLLELTDELTALHGTQVNGVEFTVQEGEKHYNPTDKKTIHEFLHFVRTEEALAVARIVAILSASSVLNFRAPDYGKILRENGLSHVWQCIQRELGVPETVFPEQVSRNSEVSLSAN